MKRYNITVNGKAYDVAVEEVGGSTAAAPVAAAPVAAAPAAPLLHLGTALHGAPDRGSLRNAGRTVGIQRVCDDQKDRR